MKYIACTWIALIVAACAGALDDESFDDYRRRSDSGAGEHDEPDAAAPEPRGVRDSGARAWDAQPDSWAGAPEEADDAGSPVVDAGPATKPEPRPDPPEPAAPACDFRALVLAKCANVSCHGAPAAGSGLDLTSPSLGTRIAGRMAGGSCTDKLLVDPDEPEHSALYLRVTGDACGVKMPLGGSLTPNEQACILTWIEGL